MLITEEWRELNAELHARNPLFGAGAWRWANAVCGIAARYGCRTILDYGCGKNTLAPAINSRPGLEVRSYDPAIPEFAAPPEAADMLVSIDTLEHVEPGCLYATLAHMASLTGQVALLVIGTRPGDKTMRDGRRAHLIIEPMGWWLDRIKKFWRIVEAQDACKPVGLFKQYRRPLKRPRATRPARLKTPSGEEFRCLAEPLA